MKKLPICKVCGKNCHVNNKLSVHDKCLKEWKRLEKERKRESKVKKEKLYKRRKEIEKQRKKEQSGHMCVVCNMHLGDNNKSGYCTKHRNHNPSIKEAKKNYQRKHSL